MKLQYIGIIIFSLYFNRCYASEINLDADIISDYFDLKQISNVLIFGCENKYAMKNLMKKMFRKNLIRLQMNHVNEKELRNDKYIKYVLKKYIKTTKFFHSGIVLFDKCENIEKILKWASILEVFDEKHKWLIISENYERTKRILNETTLRFDSDVVLMIKGNDSKDPWFAYDAYNPGKEFGGENQITYYGFWKHSSETFQNNTIDIYDKIPKNVKYTVNKNWYIKSKRDMGLRKKLMNIKIPSIIAISYKPPKGGFMKYLTTPINNAHVDSMHRYTYRLFIYMMEMFDFRIKLTRTNTWGSIKNGTVMGVLGALKNRRVEIGITPSQFKIWRFSMFDQTAVCWLGKASIMFKHPKGGGLRSNFIQPLTDNVWWSTLGVLCISIIIFKFTLKQEVKILNLKNDENADEAEHNDSWNYVLLVAITGGFCQQGFPHSPKNMSGKMTTIVILAFTFLLFQFYSASIVSSLLTEPPKTITTLTALIKSKLNILIEDVSYNYDVFYETTNPMLKDLFFKVFIPKGLKNVFLPPEIGLKKVEQGGFAFQVDVSLAYKLIPQMYSERSICDLCEIPLFPPKPIMPLVRKGSPYRQIITYGLRKMEENGIMSYQKSIWHAKKPECTLGGATDTVSVTLDETASAFALMALCWMLSLIILLLECLYVKIKSKRH